MSRNWGREGRTPFAISGVSAAYVGFNACPNAPAIRNPRPSLPVFGTDNPPVARTTASASSGSPSRARRSSDRADCRTPVTSVSVTMVTPLRRAWASSVSRTSRALCDFGNSFPDSVSSTSGNPSSRSKNAICSWSGHERTMRRSRCGDESVTKRDSSSRAGRMLQRPPPLIRILRPPSFVRSSEQCLGPLGRRENRRHRAGSAGADYDDARHASSDWRNVRLNRPDSSSSAGAVPGVMRDTP